MGAIPYAAIRLALFDGLKATCRKVSAPASSVPHVIQDLCFFCAAWQVLAHAAGKGFQCSSHELASAGFILLDAAYSPACSR